MRILHFYLTYFPDTQGGLEETIREICQNTMPAGVSSKVLTLDPRPTPTVIERPEVTVHGARLLGTVASCSFSLHAAREFSTLTDWADLIHYHFPWPFADPLYLYPKVNKPTVVTYHSDIARQRVLSRLYQPLQDRFLSPVDRIVCTSPNCFATSDVLSRFEDKVDVIPIGLGESTYPVSCAVDLARAEAQYGRDFFLLVAVLQYYKGLHVLLDAMQGAPYRVIIVVSGRTERKLRRQAEDPALTNVTFTGYLPEEARFKSLALCRAVIFPSYSRSEAFGVTRLKRAMHGKPMISTEVGSRTSQVNSDGKTGFIVPPGSHHELCRAMDRLWLEPDLALTTGRSACQRYDRLFTGRLMARQHGNLYRDILETERLSSSRRCH